MYKIKNGLLEKDGKKVLAIGQSYYPSFHNAKYPVSPEGDRIGEMKKDFRLMKEMGFNHIRVASIGVCEIKDGKTVLDTPFVDAMLKEAEKLDLSISVRIEGYAVNLRDFKNVLMVDAENNEQDTSVWFDFIQTTLNHEGLKEDDITYSEVKAKHYDKFPAVVAYQIYNEPHFPGKTFFDYHEKSIAAYRKWLIKKGIMDEKAAAAYNPPREREEQSPQMWAYWRQFNRDSLTAFLNNAASGVKNVSEKPTFTCFTTDMFSYIMPYRGTDAFANARYMDIVGFTDYIHAVGTEYYPYCLTFDGFVSAAKSENKESWCVELDSRTTIPTSLFNKNTYAAVGAGLKGIVYYQWRGDAPSEATPIPNGCGLVNYDGTKTQNYENAANTVKLLNELSDYIVNSDLPNEKIGIFVSDYAAFYCDACENGKKKRNEYLTNDYIEQITAIYTQIQKAGYSVKLLDETALDNGTFNIDTLFVPTKYALSGSELSSVRAFKAAGHTVYETKRSGYSVGGFGYLPLDILEGEKNYKRFYLNMLLTAEEILLRRGKKPLIKSQNPLIAARLLLGDGYKIICLTNLTHPTLNLNTEIDCDFDFKKVLCYESGKPARTLKSENRRIFAENISDGAFLIIK